MEINKDIGEWLDDASYLDNIAYSLYIKNYMMTLPRDIREWSYDEIDPESQNWFILCKSYEHRYFFSDTIDNDIFYSRANNIIRKEKLYFLKSNGER